MRDYLLFVDTETSGLPKDWEKPYSAAGNWPYIVQLAWVIYTGEGEKVKEENHYITAKDYEVSVKSRSIHGISDAFLEENGEEREEVMKRINADLKRYQPLVVGHFLQLDYHMLGLGFYRSGLDNPLKGLPIFCTMRHSATLLHFSARHYLRLGELYQRLFQEPLKKEHHALVDATATARCFFELRRKGDINERLIEQQQQVKIALEEGDRAARRRRAWPVVLLLLLALLTAFLLMYWLI